MPMRPRPGPPLGNPPLLVAGPGAAPTRTTSWGHTRSPDLAPSKPLPTPRTPQVPGSERGSSGAPWGGVAVDCVGANRGARALIGFAVLERGLRALRGSTLPLDPQGLIVLFLRVCPRSR